MATNRFSMISCMACIQPKRPFSNAPGSRRASTRRNVASEGMPLAKSRKRASHVPRSHPNSWIAAKELAPDSAPQTAMKTMLISGCLRVRSTRGSLRSWKWSWKAAGPSPGMIGSVGVRLRSLGDDTPLYAGAFPQATSDLYLDAAALPLLHRRRFMHAQVIHDQKHLLRRSRDQPRQEHEEYCGVHLPGIDHPPHLPLIGDRRDHVRAEPAPGHDQLRGRARPGIAATMLARRTHPRLVPPMDLPTLLRRPPLDLRVRLFQPFGHRLGILPVGFPHRLLRRVAPAPQIRAHGANRQADAGSLLDQLPNGLPGPQRRRDLQLRRALGLDRLLDAWLLFPVEEATGADRPPGAIPG